MQHEVSRGVQPGLIALWTGLSACPEHLWARFTPPASKLPKIFIYKETHWPGYTRRPNHSPVGLGLANGWCPGRLDSGTAHTWHGHAVPKTDMHGTSSFEDVLCPTQHVCLGIGPISACRARAMVVPGSAGIFFFIFKKILI